MACNISACAHFKKMMDNCCNHIIDKCFINLSEIVLLLKQDFTFYNILLLYTAKLHEQKSMSIFMCVIMVMPWFEFISFP